MKNKFFTLQVCICALLDTNIALCAKSSAEMRKSMLELKNVYKTFNIGTINEKHALNGVNLTLCSKTICLQLHVLS